MAERTVNNKIYFLALINILLWSTGNTAIALLLNTKRLSNILLIFYMSLFASIVLFISVAVTGRLNLVRKITVKELAELTVLGAIGFWLYYVLLYYGMAHLKVQQASTINYLWPTLIVLFSALIDKEALNFRKICALFVSFFGVVIIATEGHFDSLSGINFSGVLATAGAACFYALFSVLSVKVRVDTVIAMFFYAASSTVLSFIQIILSRSDIVIPTMSECFGLLYLGGLLSGVTYIIWIYVLEHGDTAKISNLAYLNPVFSLAWIRLVLGEEIKFYSYIGLGFILLGIIIQMLPRRVYIFTDDITNDKIKG